MQQLPYFQYFAKLANQDLHSYLSLRKSLHEISRYQWVIDVRALGHCGYSEPRRRLVLINY